MPRPAAGQEGRHQGFYPLNSHFLLGESGADCRHVTAAKQGNGRGFFSRRGAQCAPMSKSICSAGYRSATHIGGSPQAQHKVNCPKGKRGSSGGYPCRATRKSGDNRRHLRIYAFDTIYLRRCCLSQRANELRGTAMLRLRKLTHMCSSTVSDTANGLRKTRKKKSSAVPNFGAVTYR